MKWRWYYIREVLAEEIGGAYYWPRHYDRAVFTGAAHYFNVSKGIGSYTPADTPVPLISLIPSEDSVCVPYKPFQNLSDSFAPKQYIGTYSQYFVSTYSVQTPGYGAQSIVCTDQDGYLMSQVALGTINGYTVYYYTILDAVEISNDAFAVVIRTFNTVPTKYFVFACPKTGTFATSNAREITSSNISLMALKTYHDEYVFQYSGVATLVSGNKITGAISDTTGDRLTQVTPGRYTTHINKDVLGGSAVTGVWDFYWDTIYGGEFEVAKVATISAVDCGWFTAVPGKYFTITPTYVTPDTVGYFQSHPLFLASTDTYNDKPILTSPTGEIYLYNPDGTTYVPYEGDIAGAYEIQNSLEDWDYANCEWYQYLLDNAIAKTTSTHSESGLDYYTNYVFDQIWYDPTTGNTYGLYTKKQPYTLWGLSAVPIGRVTCGPLTTSGQKHWGKYGGARSWIRT